MLALAPVLVRALALARVLVLPAPRAWPGI